MAHVKVYEKYIEKLVTALPMDDVKFTTQLSTKRILPDSVDAHIKSLPTPSNKADYFLKKVIKSSLDIGETTEFKNLLIVMEKCGYSHVERLANKMKSDLDKEMKTKSTSKVAGKTAAPVPAKASKSKETKEKKSDDTKASKSKETKEKKSDDSMPPLKAGVKRAASIPAKSSESSGAKRTKPSDKCSKAIENITTNYAKLTRSFPIDDLLPSLYGEKVINDVQKEDIQNKKLKKEKVSFLFDVVIKPELLIDVSTKYDNLIKVMEASDDITAKHLAELLKGGSKMVPPVHTQKTTYEKFIEKYLKAKHDLGSEKLNLLKILFFGPSGAGKSTLLSVLLQQDIKSLRESTGILDRKLVQFKVAVQRDTSKSISQWKIVNIDEEILRLRRAIEEKLAERTDKRNPTLQQSNVLPLKADMKIDEKLQSVADSLPGSAGQHLLPKNEDQISKVQLKANNMLIACYDSGGQPEFFDIMPAMTTITTGNIMVLDMSKNLCLQLDSEFFKQGKHWRPSDIKTHYTTVQLLKTALANIQSHATQYSSRSATNICCKNSQLLVVGTHLDLCGDTEDKIHKRLHEVEKIICDDVLHDCSPISIVQRQKGKKTKIIHPIANRSDKDSDEITKDREEAAQEIRTAIEKMSNNDNVNKKIPVSWLLFQYEIKLQSGPCILRSDCEEIAKKCYIDEADIDDVLSFYHELGVLLYYKQIKKLEHVVFSDPQWLFNQLTKIIQLKYDPSYEAEKSIKKGIFKKKFLAEIFEKEFEYNQILHYEDLLNLFIHLNIMAGLSDTEEQYFMPALLNPAPIPISLDEEFGNKVFSTLYIRYKDRLFPRGVFCCLIALSIQKNKTWKLQTNAAYKDVVVFQIENNREYLILFDKVNYILVEIHRKDNCLPNGHQVLCYKLHENLIEVCSKIHLKGDFNFGFLCENCESSESFASVQEQYPCYPENLLCAACQHNPKMTYDQLIWFIPLNVMDILNIKNSSMKAGDVKTKAKRKRQKREESSDTESDNGIAKSKATKKIMQSTELSKALSCACRSVSDAWDLKRLDSINLNGTGTIIAILDTAINQNLPSFFGAIDQNSPTFIGKEILVINCLPGVPIGSIRHGTICSAVAVGLQSDTTPRGVAPCAQLIVYRIAEGDYVSIDATLGALDDIQRKLESGVKIDVVSISYGFDESSKDAICDKIGILTRKGITFVAAAGNRGLNQAQACIPARFDDVISVGALDEDGRKALYTSLVKVDVYAPGVFPTGDKGTSFATPAVAGLVLLLKQWANYVGSPAKENINHVDILQKIFSEDMYVKSDSTEKHVDTSQPNVKTDGDGNILVFQPVDFFMNMKDKPEKLNDIVQKHLDKQMEH